MPEGHTLHRLALQHQKLFGGRVVAASSPQGRFVGGAAMLDGRTLRRAEAYGKHLFHDYREDRAGEDLTLHIHLGLFGKFTAGNGEPPVPRGALRLRLRTEQAWTDLRGPTACELLEPSQIDALLSRLGPDPIRRDSDPDKAFRRISRSRTIIAALLMDQSVIAGIGNVYRAEILFRHFIDPFSIGRELSAQAWQELWTDLVTLMRSGVRSGRIITIRSQDRVRKRGPIDRAEAGYVYRRTGQPCRLCGTPIATAEVAGRNLFWCPSCQSN